jgi:hypothetical protein
MVDEVIFQAACHMVKVVKFKDKLWAEFAENPATPQSRQLLMRWLDVLEDAQTQLETALPTPDDREGNPMCQLLSVLIAETQTKVDEMVAPKQPCMADLVLIVEHKRLTAAE